MKRRLRTAGLVGAALAQVACGGSGNGSASNDTLDRALPSGIERVFASIALTGMTDLQSRRDAAGHPRLFVVRKNGTVEYFDPDLAVPVAQPYLDVSALFDFSTQGEQGLLGLAFDPDYERNGFLYVHVVKTGPRRVVVMRFHDDGSPPVDPATGVTVLEANEFDSLAGFANHVAGGMAFGPVDGQLYLTLGDGGSSFDPDGAAQDRSDLRGSILRIDVGATTDSSSATNYAIPPDNPFAGNTNGHREEIFAYGMRNPFRISIERIDAATQRVWVADVGQGEREEVDVVVAGRNYGWDCREGTLVVAPANASPACSRTAEGEFQPPVVEYDHSLGRSITGGYVYSGSRLAGELSGRYVYGDFVSGRIWAFDPDGGGNDLLIDTDLAISTFGVGPAGELYIGDFDGGGLYRLVP